VREALAMMRHPLSIVLTVTSRGRRGLERSLDILRRAVTALRVEAPALGFSRLIGAIHPKLGRSGTDWNVHLHAALDGKEAVLPKLAAFWERVTHGAGRLLHERRGARVKDAARFARYITDEKDWSPLPDAVSLSVLGIMIEALRHRRLIVRWGFRRKRRRWRIRRA
jgi:hypothetical protein